MTKIFTNITTLLIFYLTMQTASAQSQTNINEIMQCTLKPGYSAEEVISVGRAIPLVLTFATLGSFSIGLSGENNAFPAALSSVQFVVLTHLFL